MFNPPRRSRRIRTIVVGTLAAALALSATPAIAAWEDEGNAAQRAAAMLDRMTLEEKVEMLNGESNFDYGFYNAPIERLGIPALTMADGPAGVRVANANVNDGEATALPAPLALAATWNANLAERYGRMAGREAFNTGHNVLLSPAADIFRDPHAGRGFEAFGEDPLLSGVVAARQIQGIQSNPVLANIKHLAAYNQETNRLIDGNAVVDERAYQEVYLRPVGIAVEQGHPATAMCSFNKINGTYACENEYLLTTVLREQMKFAGFVMSDYNATHTTLESFTAGLDQEQPADYHFGQTLLNLVADGTISEDAIDTSVLRILTPMYALGLFDRPVQTDGFNESANARVAQTVAEQSAVLLKNDDALPLDAKALDSVAVIGPDADTDVAGGGSSLVKGTGSISPLEGIENRVGAGVEVNYAPGTDPISNGGALLSGPEPVPSDVFTTNGGADAGLTARYWTNLTQDGEPGINRVETSATLYLGFPSYPNLNAQSPELPETPQTYTNDMSAEWTGTLTVPRSGKYTFSLGAEGSATLFVDGVAQLDVQDATTYTADTWTVALTGGATHDVRIAYVHDTPTGTDGGPKLKFGWVPPRQYVAAQAQAAADLAKNSDVAVVVVRDLATEGVDRPNLTLPQGQEALIRAVTRANPNTIVVLTTGGPVDVSSWSDDAAGILEAWYGGQRQGTAIARLLFGDVNPSGHLPVTFPFSEEETPTATPEQYPGDGLDTQYSEGIYVGYKGYAEQDIDARYPFGFGLSYTTWRSRVTALPAALTVASDGLIEQDDLELTARVRNTGTRDGSAVVQVYAGTLPGELDTPERQLAGWARVSVDSGDVEIATITLDPKSFASWDSEGDRWVTPRGNVELFLGTSVENATSVGAVRLG